MIDKNNVKRILYKIKKSYICHCPSDKKCFGYCQSGGFDIGNGYWHGKSRGCKEIDFCINLLNKLTNKEIEDIIKR